MAATGNVLEHVRSFVVTAVAVALVAGPVGALWAHVVPHAGFVLGADGGGALFGEDAEFIRADGWFLVMTAIVGALTGLVAWAVTAGQNPASVVGLAAGSIFAAYAVARIGQQHNSARLHLAADAHENGASDPLTGHYPPLAHGSIFMWAFAALLVYTVLAAVITRR